MSTAPQVTPDPSKPIEIELGNGMVIKGANLEEAIQNAKKIVTDNVTAYRTEREKREQAESEAQALRSQLDTRRAPEPANGFNTQRYWQLFNEDPIAAQNYMDQARFGVQDPVASFNQMRQAVDNFTQQSVAAAFTAQHAADFPPASAPVLRQRVEDLVFNEGFRLSLDTLNYAYNQLVADGSITPLETAPEPEPTTPNPSLTGSSGQVSDSEISRAEQMSDEDLRKYLRSKGMNV